jgi:hypothetical protein
MSKLMSFLLNKLKIYALFLRNYLKRNELDLVSFSALNEVESLDGKLDFQWNVDGCHKIIIGDIIVLSGDTSGVYLPRIIAPEELEITFLGTRNSITKTVHVQQIIISVEKAFQFDPSLPNLNAAEISIPNLDNEFSKSINVCENLTPKILLGETIIENIEPIKVNIKINTFKKIEHNLKVEMPSFDLSKYNTNKSTN